MLPRSATRWLAALGLALAAGCLYPVRDKIDKEVCDLAHQPIDLQPVTVQEPASPMPRSQASLLPAGFEVPVLPPPTTPEKLPTTPAQQGTPGAQQPRGGKAGQPGEEPPAREGPGPSPPTSPYALPPGLLPGGRTLTPWKVPSDPAQRREFYRRLFTPLPPLGPDPTPVPGPGGRPLTLADLQQLAMSNGPAVKEATAAVEAARGTAYQAGLWPNPNIGFEVDTFGTTGGAGYVGGFVEQLIKTAGKMQLARAVSTMDLRNAQLALRKAESDTITRVRRGYFQVLVARENIRLSHLLADFAERAYRANAEIVQRGGFAAAYEPLYFRYLAAQARGNLVVARNRYISAWKQLAAAMGVPAMPLTEIVGRVDMPLPVYKYDRVLAHILRYHTDMLTAETSFAQARLNVQMAQVQPYPDVDVRLLVQRDYTGPPFEVSPSLQVSIPFPVWNRNQGGIQQAQANLVQQSEEPHRVRGALTTTLSDAFERYQNGRLQLALYRDIILPDLVRVYTGITTRYHAEAPGIGPGAATGLTSLPAFSDIVVAQGNLSSAFAAYITWLDTLWQSTVDVTDLLQTKDFFQVNGQPTPTECLPSVPDLGHLAALPCDHPCSPLPGLYQLLGDGHWPPALPGPEAPRMKPAASDARRTPPASLDRPQAAPVVLPAPVPLAVAGPGLPPRLPTPWPLW
jgi:cobalt-zinc-cadmium efflux system outer membrane protein